MPDRVWSFTDRLQGPYAQNLATDCGDFVVRRADGVYVYQLAVTVDDGLTGVTEVGPGVGPAVLGPPANVFTKLVWLFCARLCPCADAAGPCGRRLSKRDGDLDMSALRRQYETGGFAGALGYTAGLLEKPEAVSAMELARDFSWDRGPEGRYFHGQRRIYPSVRRVGIAICKRIGYNGPNGGNFWPPHTKRRVPIMKKPILVVMAAGMGSRYGGLKQIDPVGAHGEAILDYSLYDAHEAGV